MNELTSKPDIRQKQKNQRLVKQRVDFNVHNHHKTELLEDNYRGDYNLDFKPNMNDKVPNR